MTGSQPQARGQAAMPLLLLTVVLFSSSPKLCTATDPVPLLITWFYGTPYLASYIGQGETVTWLWKDKGNYSVEGEGSSASVFQGLGGGANAVSQQNFSYQVTFTKPGTYDYHCHNHPYIMTGQIIVKKKYNFGGVTIPWFLGISFGGASAIIREGDTVSWLWSDDLPHAIADMNGDVTMFTGPGSNNDTVSGESTFLYKKKFTKPGVYLYKCQNHGAQMQGNITVLPKSTSAGLEFEDVPTSDTPLGSPAPPASPAPAKKNNAPAGKLTAIIKKTTRAPAKTTMPATKSPAPATKTTTPAATKTKSAPKKTTAPVEKKKIATPAAGAKITAPETKAKTAPASTKTKATAGAKTKTSTVAKATGKSKTAAAKKTAKSALAPRKKKPSKKLLL